MFVASGMTDRIENIHFKTFKMNDSKRMVFLHLNARDSLFCLQEGHVQSLCAGAFQKKALSKEDEILFSV